MQTIVRAGRNVGKAGEPLPSPFTDLEDQGVHFRRGQITLVAAAPGKGKSVLAMRLATHAVQEGLTALYVSADTDAVTMRNRVAASLTTHPVATVEEAYHNDAGEFYDDALQEVNDLRWSFLPQPSTVDVEQHLLAYAAVYGSWPDVVVVDNLSNLYVGESEGTSGLERAMDYLHSMARYTGSAVVVLHHLTGDYDDGNQPAPLSALRGKVSKIPETILTLFSAGEGVMGVCPVKNRTGKADATAQWQIWLTFYPERMTLR